MTPPSPLSSLPRVRLAAAGAQSLKQAIVAGVFPPGSALPNEKELARQLGVTRLTLRESLAMLEATGFATRRHGSGTYVADLAGTATLAILMDMLGAGRPLLPHEAVALMKFREVVIGGFAPAVAQAAQGVHVVRLGEILAEARTHSDAAALAQLDYQWNEVLAQASGNLFYELLIRSVRTVHIQLGTVVFGQVKDNALIVATQAAVVSALAHKDAARLQRALRQYLQGGTQAVEAWLASQPAVHEAEGRAQPSVRASKVKRKPAKARGGARR